MGKRETMRLFLRLGLIMASMMLLAFLWSIEASPVKVAFMILLVLILIGELWSFLIHWRRETLRFLQGLASADPARLQSATGNMSQDLVLLFNQLSDRLRTLKLEKEQQYRYLAMLVEQLEVAVVCISGEEEELVLSNEAWRILTGNAHAIRLRSLEPDFPVLISLLREHRPGMRQTYRGENHSGQITYALGLSAFTLSDKSYRLFTLTDIHAAMRVGEMEAWQRLLRVLTHEIMNSIAPISSLSETLSQQMKHNLKPSETMLHGWAEAMQAIASRSENLLAFTNRYRQLSRLPEPRFAPIPLKSFIENIWLLFIHSYASSSFSPTMTLACEEALTIKADKGLLEQVLLNIFKNAVEACGAGVLPHIQVEAVLQGEMVEILIKDNGEGFPPGLESDLFLPFFTTKPEGSGIGLSLCRQIVLRHGGEIRLLAAETGACVAITLPAIHP
ncbi:MAG: ATP-binding protein [Bacteroidia bacterium]|nr:ATP-binding protein [Bacteroidia bacterium]